MMRLLDYLTEVFIGTFGITQPSAARRRQASLIIGGFLLGGLLAGFAVVGFFLYSIQTSR